MTTYTFQSTYDDKVKMSDIWEITSLTGQVVQTNDLKQFCNLNQLSLKMMYRISNTVRIHRGFTCENLTKKRREKE